MEPITPHNLSLHLLKFPDIVKLNTCILFHDYFHHEKFPNIPVSLVSQLHNHPIKFSYPNFDLILGDLAPPLLDVSSGIMSCISLGTNHLKKYLEKHFCAGTLLNTNGTFSFLFTWLSSLTCAHDTKFFKHLVRKSFQNDEEWRLCYSDSTLGCRVIQDLYLCKLDMCDVTKGTKIGAKSQKNEYLCKY